MSEWELEFEDTFDGAELDPRRWLPHYLPQWSSRERSAARCRLGPGGLGLLIEADQPPWCPEFDGDVPVSSLQTGVFSGPLGSGVGQHRFTPRAVVREQQETLRLYTPHYARIEIRMRALDDPRGEHVKTVGGSPDYPMQLMLNIYEFPGEDDGRPYPKVFHVESVRGYRRA